MDGNISIESKDFTIESTGFTLTQEMVEEAYSLAPKVGIHNQVTKA